MQACHNLPWKIPFVVPIKLPTSTSQSRSEKQVKTLQPLKYFKQCRGHKIQPE